MRRQFTISRWDTAREPRVVIAAVLLLVLLLAAPFVAFGRLDCAFPVLSAADTLRLPALATHALQMR